MPGKQTNTWFSGQRDWPSKRPLLRPKKVGTLPIGDSDVEKQTNEIKIAAPLLDTIDIEGRTITVDALLTQRQLAQYLVARGANYHFTVKLNQRRLHDDISDYFQHQTRNAEFCCTGNGEHGRIETRQIWTTTRLNDYLELPHVGQAFMIIKRIYFEENRQNQSWNSLWYDKPVGTPNEPATNTGWQPRPLVSRELPLDDRLELWRGSLSDPYRLWPWKHHAAQTLCYRYTENKTIKRDHSCHDEKTLVEYPRRLWLFENDQEF